MKKWHYLFFLLLLPLVCPAQVMQKIPNLDSRYRETNLSITPNGKYLFFMSQRGGMPWSSPRQSYHGHGPQYDGDIWYAVKQGDGWSDPKCLTGGVNTYSGEDEPNVTADGQAVYFQSWRNAWEYSGGPYYRAALNGTNWGQPVGLGGNITQFFRDLELRLEKAIDDDLKRKGLYRDYIKFSMVYPNSWAERLKSRGFDITQYILGTDGMAISPDEKIFIVSAYIPSRKKYDLYISRRPSADGEWSYPQPLDIPNGADEISVYIAGDNQTVYFASNQPGGMGGYDIYKTTLLGGTACAPPENIGAPYNSTRDEYSFVVDPTDDKAYQVIDGAIHEMQLLDKAKPNATLVINGRVQDPLGNPLEARILLLDKADPTTPLATARSNSETGEYSFSLAKMPGDYQQYAITIHERRGTADFQVDEQTPSALDFTIIIEEPATSAAPEEETLDRPEEDIATIPKIAQESPATPTSDDKAKVVDALADKNLEAGTILQVDKLFFKADQAEIEPGSYEVLDQIATTLNDRPEIKKVEIGGHTNSLPPAEYCDRLSAQRAKAIYEYLRQKQVDPDRLVYKGYGKRAPIASNDTPDGRQKNQRVEIKILEVGK
ncbi:MAG TPA: OmpA family protein [Saprospiraceae bacterium]|nr:OmpA family protein [Saprospiraceae bacterium]